MSLNQRLEAYSDRLNPVWIKDLRQMFHNRISLGGCLLLLAGNLVAFAFQVRRMTDSDGVYGPQYLLFSLVLLTTVGSLAFGVSMGLRYGEEVKSGAIQLMLLTSLSGRKLLNGKLSAALSGGILLLSMSLPFLLLSLFMRGVTWKDVIGGIIGYLYCFLFVTMGAMLFGGVRNIWVRCGLIYMFFQFSPMIMGLVVMPLFFCIVIGAAGMFIPYIVLLALIK